MRKLTWAQGRRKLRDTLKRTSIYLSFHFAGQAGNVIDYVISEGTSEEFNQLLKLHKSSHYYITFDSFPDPIRTTCNIDKVLPLCEVYKNIFDEHGLAIELMNTPNVYKVHWTSDIISLVDETDVKDRRSIYIPHNTYDFWRKPYVFYKDDSEKGSW